MRMLLQVINSPENSLFSVPTSTLKPGKAFTFKVSGVKRPIISWAMVTLPHQLLVSSEMVSTSSK